MAQSTEDYLDSLLRQAMGIPDPEPEKKPEEPIDLAREDVLAMADGLTGSNSAILGNAYDHNASFTNEGEIEIHTPAADKVTAVPDAIQPDAIQPDAADTFATSDTFATGPVSGGADGMLPTDSILPETEEYTEQVETAGGSLSEDLSDMPSFDPDIPMADITESVIIPDGPVIEHDGNLDIIPEPSMMEEIPLPDQVEMPSIGKPVVEEPVIETPVIEDAAEAPVLEDLVIDEPGLEELVSDAPAIDETIPDDSAPDVPAVEIPAVEEPVIEKPLAEEPVIEEPVIEETAIEEPAIDEPLAEETAIEEPVIEEPAIEEPAIEEPVIEEPVEEAAPGLSIDDLDPNDSTKALDADTIAALFANANAEAEEPAVEESAAEESAIEEPAVEEPAIEEPAIEETATEEPVSEEIPAEEIPAEEISADETTADEASPEEEPVNIEESAQPEETVTNDPFAEGDMDSLEALDMSLGEPEDAPLMPDQEISDLLSTLGEITGEAEEGDNEPAEESAEDTAEESPAQESDAAEESAPAEEAAADDAPDLGIDMFDTDLSAMLDDVTTNLDFSGEGEGEASSEDSDLNELLGSLDDGSGDLSDIGSMLDKDENSELVDPNTETAEALFASDSEEQLFDIDNLIDEEENPKDRKKKKKFSLFGKKNKDSDIEVLGGDEEMLIDPSMLDIPEKDSISKKPGFFARLLAKLFEEVGEDTDDVSGIEQSAVDIAAEGAAENEAILSELEQEEAGGKKEKKKKEKKKKEKKDKKGKGGDSEGEEGEEAAEEPKKKKKEKKKKEKESVPELPSKKLPRKKVVAISLFCITIGLVITFLAFLLPYSQDINKAKKFYATGEYQKTYEYMRGHKLTSDDQILYDRTVTLLRIKRPYDSYQNYMKMGLRMEALNALVQGVQMTDKYAEEAARLGIIDKYSQQARLVYDELYNTFGVSVDKARSWIELEGTPEYTRALYSVLVDNSPVSADTQEEFSFDVEQDNDPVINAEENDL